jgi:CheY-like chemotaxis protein
LPWFSPDGRWTGPASIMPGMTGPEAVRQIAERRPEARVLYVSGYTQDAIGEHGVLSLDAAFLSKPFTSQDLLGKVRQLLDRV